MSAGYAPMSECPLNNFRLRVVLVSLIPSIPFNRLFGPIVLELQFHRLRQPHCGSGTIDRMTTSSIPGRLVAAVSALFDSLDNAESDAERRAAESCWDCEADTVEHLAAMIETKLTAS